MDDAGPAGLAPANDAELVALSDDWSTAIVTNDPEQIGAFMADEWVLVSGGGITTRDRFLSVIASGELSHSAMQRVSQVRLVQYGETALLSCRVTNTAHYGGERLDADEWTTDVWRQDDGRWRCVLTHITPVDEGT